MDAALVARLQRKDHAAGDELIARYGDELYGYIYCITHDHKQSEALLSTTLLRVVEQIDRYNAGDAAFRTWLYRIASTVVANGRMVTKGSVRVSQRAVSAASVDAPAATEIPLNTTQSQERLYTLALEQRQIILLRCVAHLSLEEIAYVLGKPTRAVEQLQLQALRAFGHLLMRSPS